MSSQFRIAEVNIAVSEPLFDVLTSYPRRLEQVLTTAAVVPQGELDAWAVWHYLPTGAILSIPGAPK